MVRLKYVIHDGSLLLFWKTWKSIVKTHKILVNGNKNIPSRAKVVH